MASVRVMRSYDYCQFEVSLDVPDGAPPEQVNARRKQAALLVDEAVRQYKIAKKAEQQRDSAQWKLDDALAKIERIKALPRSEWTVEQAALMRAYEDQSFWKMYQEDDYFYDDGEREHHFSMLRRFEGVKIQG